MRIENFQIQGNVRPDGYTDEMILNDVRCISVEVERRFGAAANEWVIGGIVFDPEEEQPHLFYPFSRPRTVIIKLTGQALSSVDFARFQLAHELVHCINPSGANLANVLEEGMAACFQQSYATKMLKGRVRLGNEKYIDARKLYNKFVKKSKVCDPIVRLRSVEPYLYKITHETFITAGIILPQHLESLLLMSFEDFCKSFDNLSAVL